MSFKFDGGIGGFMAAYNKKAYLSDYRRFIFDNIYNFLISLVMLSIVAGIIIDKFSVKR